MIRLLRNLKGTAAVLLFALSTHAQPQLPDPTSTLDKFQTYNEYYTLNEKASADSVSSPSTSFQYGEVQISLRDENGFLVLPPGIDIATFLSVAKKTYVNLLSWILHNEKLQIPQEKYIRKLHFGRWINDPTDDTCMNTRARVLVRDSLAEVTYRNEKKCVVDGGRWQDPYAGVTATFAKDLQIDHMVPLKHAYVTGAWKWDYKTRCLYANYMGFKNHLVTADAHENMSKGDRSPDQYIPPNSEYTCEYLRSWLAVKLIWKLAMTTDEVTAVDDLIRTNKCSRKSFRFAEGDLKKQRDYINDNLNFCIVNSR